MDLLKSIAADLEKGDHEAVRQKTQAAIDAGLGAAAILDGGLLAGMAVVGERFRTHEIFLPEVLLAARAMHAGLALLKPLLVTQDVPSQGRVVIGTIRGDLHDIGKNLVAMMMEGAGFEVINIGINNSVEDFMAAIEEHQPDIVGMSALLTTTMPYMRVVIDALKEAGIRKDLVVLVGGAPLNEAFAEDIEADAYCRDAAVAVETAKKFMEIRKARATT